MRVFPIFICLSILFILSSSQSPSNVTLLSSMTQNLTAACYQGFLKTVPPNFCFKKPIDLGHMPNFCPENYTFSLGVCHKNCESDKNMTLGVCWSKSGVKIASKLKAVCPEGTYKGAFLCHRDCKTIYMENCGILGCSATKQACVSAVVNMAIDIVIALGQQVLFLASFGWLYGNIALYKSSALAVANIVKKLGFNAIKSIFQKTKAWLVSQSENKLVSLVSKAAENIIGKDFDINIFDTSLSFVCKQVSSIVLEQINNTDEPNISIKDLDVFNLGNTLKSCKNLDKSEDPNDKIACIKETLTSLSIVDPTALTAIAAAVVHPICEGI